MKIGNGITTYLWHDNWHPLGTLILKYKDRIVFDPGLESQAIVSTIIRDQNWQWPNAQTCELIEIRNFVIGDMVPSDYKDQSVWTLSPNGISSVQSDWDLLKFIDLE